MAETPTPPNPSTVAAESGAAETFTLKPHLRLLAVAPNVRIIENTDSPVEIVAFRRTIDPFGNRSWRSFVSFNGEDEKLTVRRLCDYITELEGKVRELDQIATEHFYAATEATS